MHNGLADGARGDSGLGRRVSQLNSHPPRSAAGAYLAMMQSLWDGEGGFHAQRAKLSWMASMA